MLSSALPSAYPYRPLKSDTTIRILVLHPSTSFDAKLEASIIHTVRGEHGRRPYKRRPYEAVSYCWGDPITTHSITIDSEWSLGISANVDSMLRHLRKSRKPRNLWVDAICLNQVDIEEKNVQVQRMDTIYLQAFRTHIWLGGARDTDKIPEIFNTLRAMSIEAVGEGIKLDRVGMAPSSEDENAFYGPSDLDRLESNPNNTVSDASRDMLQLLLTQLLNRPWFERRWIIQEVILSERAIFWCGNWNIFGTRFSEGILRWLIHIAGSQDDMLIPAIDSIRAICGYHSPTTIIWIQYGTDILSLMWNFHRSRCFAPHDTIYALLGIATHVPDKLKKVDYSTPWNEVFTDLAAASFPAHATSMFLHLLSFRSLAQYESTWPSWVPNWTNQREAMLIPKSHPDRDRETVGTQWSTEVIVPQNGPITLRIGTAFLGEVQVLGKTSNSLYDTIHSIMAETQDSESKARVKGYLSVLLEVLLVHTYTRMPHDPVEPRNSVQRERYELNNLSNEQLQKGLKNILDTTTEHINPPPGSLNAHEKHILLILEFKLINHIIVSNLDGDNITIAPHDTLPGDILTYRPGFLTVRDYHGSHFSGQVDMGFILRPSEIASDIPEYTRPLEEPSSLYLGQYRFVGPCYTLRTWIENVDPEEPRVTVDIV
jgi:hypothetical protein